MDSIITNPEFCLASQLYYGLFVKVHGWQNHNNKMAECGCFAIVSMTFLANITS